MKIDITCGHCGTTFKKEVGHINRAKKLGLGLYCNRKCAGIARRVNRTQEEKKEIKRLYDIRYRENNEEYRKSRMQAYNSSPSGRAMQKRNRDKFKESHAAYVKTPEYRKWKHEYDQKYHAKKNFGDFWEAFLILKEIDKEIEPEILQVRIEKGYYNKSQKRKRLWNSMQRTLNKHYGTPYKE